MEEAQERSIRVEDSSIRVRDDDYQHADYKAKPDRHNKRQWQQTGPARGLWARLIIQGSARKSIHRNSSKDYGRATTHARTVPLFVSLPAAS